MTTRILVGHVLDRLRELPAESVHCCVTSPPYYGLRDYGVEPQVWGDDLGCEHEWGGECITVAGRSDGGRDIGGRKGNYQGDGPHKSEVGTGAFCRRCNAWRGSLGLEPTPALYIEHTVAVFRAVRRVLRKDGTLWLNMGDSYTAGGGTKAQAMNGYKDTHRAAFQTRQQPAGIKPKDLLGMPWALAFALRDDGWYLRSEITWAKRAPMPESVTDRPTSATEKVFLLSRSARYFYDAEAVKEESETDPKENYPARAMITGRGQQGFAHARGDDRDKSGGFPIDGGKRNMRNWWLLGPEPFPDAHFATFPTEIPRRAIMAGCPKDGTVLDPFLGAGTTALVADQLGRDCIGIELNQTYAAMAEQRLRDDAGLFADIAAD